MSLTGGVIASLHNGVSQQTPLARAPEQCELQDNGWSSLADGLQKRPASEHVARLFTTPPSDALIHEINRDTGERYVVVASGGQLRVFDFAGVEKTVTAPDGWGYLAGITDHAAEITMVTVADYTFVVNRTKVCELDPEGADETADPNYYLWLNRTFGIDDGDAYGPGYAYQYVPNSAGATTIAYTVQSFDKLPETATDGQIAKVAGSDETLFKSYYVRFGGGTWNETVKPGLKNAVKASTMPHALVREADGTFSFAPFSWAPRRVGDTASNPNPPFIGRPIQGVFFYQNRLAFLVDEQVVMSGSGDFGNFWRMTVLDYIDSDVLSVAASTTKVSVLKNVVTFNDGLILSSDQTQFSLTNGESGIGPTTIAIRPVTSYEVNTKAGMVAMGTEVYFASESNGFSVMREYTRQSDSDTTAASDITAHVPRYVPSGIRKLIPAVDRNALFVLTDSEPGSVYVYQFYWLSNSQKAQSAWHRWTFDDAAVLSGVYLGGYLYLLLSRADGLYLERLSLQSGATAPGVDYPVHLDRLASVTGTYNGTTQRTTFTLPYAPDQDTFRLVRTDAFGTPLSVVDPTSYTWASSTSVSVPGNLTAGPLLGGCRYTFRYVFSALYLRRQDGTAVTTGRTQLRTFTVNYRDTAYFKTVVAPYGTDPATEEVLPGKIADFTGKVLGAQSLVLGSPVFHSGDYAFQIYGQADVARIELVNDAHTPATFLSAEWEALYWNRASI
jgi:hypothetical protein